MVDTLELTLPTPTPTPMSPHPPIRLSYTYEHNARFVKVDDWDLPVYVEECNDHETSDTRKKSLSIVHNNFLPTVGIYRVDATHHTLYYKGAVSLESYVTDPNTVDLVQTYTIPSSCTDPQTIITYNYVSNKYRVFFRSVIKFVNYLHRVRNSSISTLKLKENFIVHDGELKLYGLTFIPDSSHEEKKKDFSMLAEALEELFPIWTMPKEIVDLCQCMRTYDRENDYFLLENHLAVLITRERLDHIKAFWERSKAGISNQTNVYRIVFENMTDTNWTPKFQNPIVGSDPLGTAVRECYKFNERKNGNSHYHIKDVTDLYDLNSTAIRFCRDMATHLLHTMPCPYYELNRTVADVELTIMALFADQLLSFEKEAHARDILDVILPSDCVSPARPL